MKQRQEQTDEEKYWLGMQLDDLPYSSVGTSRPATPLQAARKGFEFYKRLQSEDGHWAGEYGGERCLLAASFGGSDLELGFTGPLFLLPGIVFAMYITQTPIPEEWKVEMARYLASKQRNNGEGDEGWGL